MKLFERVIERSYLEDIGFINKYQSGFRQNKSTDDHLFRLSQSVMESFNRREHVVAAFLDFEKAFHNVWHNGLRYKIFIFLYKIDNRGPQCFFFLGKRDWARPHNQVVIVHCLIELFDSRIIRRMICVSLCYQQMQKLLECTVGLVNQTALRALCFFK